MGKMPSEIPPQHAAMLERYGLTLTQEVVLDQIFYEPFWHIDKFAEKAGPLMGGFFERFNVRPPTTKDYTIAIDALCSRGLIVIVDFNFRSMVIEFVRSMSCIGPTDGIPFPGQVEFTFEGAGLKREMLNCGNRNVPKDFYWHQGGAFIYRRSEVVMLSSSLDWPISHATECKWKLLSKPQLIGPWRTQWWREIPSGFGFRYAPSKE